MKSSTTRTTPSRPSRPVRNVLANLTLLVCSLGVLLAVVELTLRWTGFSYVLYPKDIEFGRPDPVMLEVGFLPDDDVFWLPKDYPQKLERLRRERPPLLMLGDSCTHLGRYDEALARLTAERQGKTLRFGNLGVAGWSSYQGRQQLLRDALPLEPKVVTVYFGWNDHWIGFGIEDKNVAQVRRTFASRWSDIRLVQLGSKAAVAWGARETAYPNRVSLEDFRDNLTTMVQETRRAGAVPVLLTAPSSHREGHEPAYLEERWLRQISDLVPLHQAYAQAVRQVAEQQGSGLCDLEKQFAALPRPQLEASFRGDGIHATEAGDATMGEFLYDCFERLELWPTILD